VICVFEKWEQDLNKRHFYSVVFKNWVGWAMEDETFYEDGPRNVKKSFVNHPLLKLVNPRKVCIGLLPF
jgi:hypothetical protein